MSDRRANHHDLFERIHRLVTARINDETTPEQFAQLDALLADNAEARRLYVQYIYETLALPSLVGTDDSPAVEEGLGFRGEGSGVRGQGSENVNPKSQIPNQQISFPESPVPPVLLDLSAPLSSVLSPLPSFVGGPVFSYMVATVILGAMLLGAWAYKITHYQQSAEKQSPSNTRPEIQFVGQITGLVDCRWADPGTQTYLGSSIPLGRKYTLASGLMEITYKSGAKVILEGPCAYEVESRAGGYLSLGKLTARIEKRGERRGERAKLQATNPKSPNLQISKSPNHYPLSTIHYPLFSVRTPTATVTDLGTEFGVEVSKDGNTVSYVFRGSVKVKVAGDGAKRKDKDVVLRSNESARVEKDHVAGEARLVLSGKNSTPPKFVRRLVEPPKLLDLLDIVAGGNGTGNRRERGIDPTSGGADLAFVAQGRQGGSPFHPVDWHRLIDGVFVPDGDAVAVQLDSAGHEFDGFRHGYVGTFGSIWARAAEVVQDDQAQDLTNWVYYMGPGEKFMPEGRGLLALHPNAGITFDLQAMREMFPEVRPARFKTTAGLADARTEKASRKRAIEVWVFVDGRLKGPRPARLQLPNAPISLDIELGPDDRFLTLVTIDSSRGIAFDWLVLGDPRLQMVPVQEENKP